MQSSWFVERHVEEAMVTASEDVRPLGRISLVRDGVADAGEKGDIKTLKRCASL